MAYLPLIGAPLAAVAYYCDSSLSIKMARHFFSEEFGQENRLKYLNYIRVPNGQPQSYYEKSVGYLVEHPVLARRLMLTADIAFRAIEILGCSMCAVSCIAALGLTGAAAGIIKYSVLVPMATKLLAEKWPALGRIDRIVNGLIVTGASLNAVCGLYPYEFISSTLFGWSAMVDALSPVMMVFFKFSMVTKEAKAHWDKFLSYQQFDEKFKGGSCTHVEMVEILKKLKDDDATAMKHFKWSLLEKRKTDFELTLTKAAFDSLVESMKVASFDRPEEIEATAKSLREIITGSYFSKFYESHFLETMKAYQVFKDDKVKLRRYLNKLNEKFNEATKPLVSAGQLFLSKSIPKLALHKDRLS